MLIKNVVRNFSKFRKYDYKDPLDFQSMLTEQEKMVLESSERFSQEYLMPQILEANRKEEFNKDIYKYMGEEGFFGSTLTDYDCAGISSVGYGLINRALERVDSSYRSIISVQSSLVIHAIHTFGSKEIKDKYLPKLISGELIGAFGLTEPDHGSDPGSMKTKAIKDGDRFLLSGSKTWITSSPIADIFVIWAKDENNEIRGFVAERSNGLETPKIEGKFSLRASCTGMIMMDNVVVPEKNLLDVKGLKGPFSCLNKARFGISWGVIGAAEFCFHQALDYTLNRKQFDSVLAGYQIPQKKFAEMQTEISLSTLAALQVGRNMDNNNLATEMISLIKRNNCIKALNICREARDMLGGNGIVDEYHIIRHLMNLETVITYEGTQDIHALILGRATTGIQSFTRNL